MVQLLVDAFFPFRSLGSMREIIIEAKREP